MVLTHYLKACTGDPLPIHLGEITRKTTVERAVKHAEFGFGSDHVGVNGFNIRDLESGNDTLRHLPAISESFHHIATAQSCRMLGPITICDPLRKLFTRGGPAIKARAQFA